MTPTQLNHFVSAHRFNIYIAKVGGDFEKAFQLYKINIELSEAFYPILAVLEISLRNAINKQLTDYFNNVFWFNNLPEEFSPFITNAIRKVSEQHKNVTADRIIAELTFGFWNRLFNRRHTLLLWRPLRLIFENMPKHLRKRDRIADILHRTRTLRNRIYHYEPIFGDIQAIETQYNEMLMLLTWLDKDLPQFLTGIDRVQEIVKKSNLRKADVFDVP